MFECCDNPAHLCQFPTELIIYIFKFLSAQNLIACRRVCKRWKDVVDDISNDENMWERHCKKDFGTLYKDARRKSNSCRLWYDVYRSISLWYRLQDATEVRDEFCHSSISNDEIEDLLILKNSEICVHKRASIVYYDMSTLDVSERSTIKGEFTKFFECDDAIIILGSQLHLRIMKKSKLDSKTDEQEQIQFHHIKHFRLFSNKVYFIHFSNHIIYCDLDQELKGVEIPRTYEETVLTLSLYNGLLHFITMECNVYKYENKRFSKLFTLDGVKCNIFDCLWQYQFIEHIDWRVFYIWVSTLRIVIPEGPLRYICMMKIYGDIIFVGCKNGVVLIYNKPFTDGHLDLYKHKPVKQYNFGERHDIPVLSLHPILKIDIAEIKDGHKLLIAMPKKIIIITYRHNFEVEKSKAVLPYVPLAPIVLV